MTGASDRPSRSPLENRTAAELKQERQTVRSRRRKAIVAIHAAEMDLLVASQRAARRAAALAIDAALSARHAGAIAAVVSRYADRRSALAGMTETERAAALRQLASDEAHELARLALEHAGEKRALRKSALLSMSVAHEAARRSLRLRNRRQRIVVAVHQHEAVLRSHTRSNSGRRWPAGRGTAPRSHPSGRS